MKIILTGASGLIGSRFEELLNESHEIIPLSSEDVDITDPSSVTQFFSNKDADVVIHFAGKTDVDGCESDKVNDYLQLNIDEFQIENLSIEDLDVYVWKNGKSAFAVNTVGTLNLYKASKEKGIKFIYISTDFVFKGESEYDENSTPSPVNWYGMTKYLGEKIITGKEDCIVRLSFPYGFQSPVKKDFVWKLHDLLRDRNEVALVNDQTITPTFIDDIVWGLDHILQNELSGVFHITGSNSLTPKEIGLKIKEAFSFTTQINDTTLDALYAGKAPRPFKSITKNARLVQLGYTPKTFEEGLGLIS